MLSTVPGTFTFGNVVTLKVDDANESIDFFNQFAQYEKILSSPRSGTETAHGRIRDGCEIVVNCPLSGVESVGFVKFPPKMWSNRAYAKSNEL